MKKSLLWLALLAAPLAAEPQLFVRNQPFAGPVRWFPTRTLAPLDDLLDSLGCSWTQAEGRVEVRCTPRSDSGGPPLLKPAPIQLEGRPVRIEQHIQQDRVFVDVDQLAQALQCQYRRSPDGSTLDLYGPLLMQGLGEGALVGSADKPEFPMQVLDTKIRLDEGRVRGFVRFANRGTQAYRLVLVRVSLYEKNGRLLGRFGEVLHRMGPGQVASVQLPRLDCSPSATPVVRTEFELR